MSEQREQFLFALFFCLLGFREVRGATDIVSLRDANAIVFHGVVRPASIVRASEFPSRRDAMSVASQCPHKRVSVPS